MIFHWMGACIDYTDLGTTVGVVRIGLQPLLATGLSTW